MKNRFRAATSALAVVAGVSLVPVLTAGQTRATAPKEPDLQGIWYAFEQVPLERPAEYAGKALLSEEELAAREARATWLERLAVAQDKATKEGRDRRLAGDADVAGAYNAVWTPGRDHRKPSRRTSLIVDPPDGKIPPLTPEAQKRAADYREYQQMLLQGTPKGAPGQPPNPAKWAPPPNYNQGRLPRPPQGPEDRSRTERCLGLSLPAFGGRIYHRIVQSPGVVGVYYEPSGHSGANRVIPVGEARHVPLPSHVRQYLGDPRGRWEGKTLVVETTNFSHKTDYQGSGQNLRLTERFTRLDANTLRYEVTVEDPTTWTKPWTIRADMEKMSDFENALYEPSCHEGNYGLIGILSAARAEEKTFREGRGPNPDLQDITLQDGPAGISGEE